MIREWIVTLTVAGVVTGTAFITWAIGTTAWPLWIYTVGVSWWFLQQLDKEPA